MRRTVALALFSLSLLVVPLRGQATDYTDLWWSPGENGWNLTITQSDNFIFATIFVYDANKQPIWYVGNLASDTNGNYSGGLYATTGPYFGTVPYDPAQFQVTQVGMATFAPRAADTAVLTYNVGGVNVAKNMERFTLTPIRLAGKYSGGQAGNYSGSGCSGAGHYTDHFDVQVNQPGDGTASFVFAYKDSGLNCTLSGSLQQKGTLYSIPSATYICSDGLNTNASLSQIKATLLSIEGVTSRSIDGVLAAPSVGGGCREDAAFSGVFDF
jgi:hypothetical protein